MSTSSSMMPTSGNRTFHHVHRHYTDAERLTLVQLVLDRIEVIEARQSDAMTLAHKQETWQEIVDRFNADPSCVHPRDKRQIKKLWDNVKTRAKRMIADRRLQVSLSRATWTTKDLGSDRCNGGEESEAGDDFADLDMLAGTSVAEKVIYFMNRLVPQWNYNRRRADGCDGDDDCDVHHSDQEVDDGDEESPISYTDQDNQEEYVSTKQIKQELVGPNKYLSGVSEVSEILTSRPTPSKCSDSSFLLSKRRSPIRRTYSAEVTGENLGTPGGPMSQHEPRNRRTDMDTHIETQDDVVFLCEGGNQLDDEVRVQVPSHPGQSLSHAPAAASCGDGWVTAASQEMSDQDGSQSQNQKRRVVVDAAPQPKKRRRSLKALQKLECELRIRKLRQEMKYTRIEHEEKMKVLHLQQNMLNSVKSNPSSIINSIHC